MATVRQLIVSVLAALLAAIAAAALAQPSRDPAAAGPQVEAFDVEQVPALSPGTQLHFSLFGTPDAAASLQIDGARRGLDLHEVQPGIYEGSYTIDAQDRIPPDGQVVATLRRGHRAAQSVLEEPLLLAGGTAAAPAETIEEHAQSTARPRIGTPVPRTAAPAAPTAPACDDCAVVESIRAVDLGGNPGYVGAFAGGLVGALLGDQVGRGDGRRLARIMGALGGAVAGREIERSGSRRTRYDVVLRLPDGAVQTRSFDRPPPFTVGDTVRLLAAPAAPF